MKRLILGISTFLAILVMQNPLSAQVHISGALRGTLSTNTYIVDDSIYVEAGESLTIEPGCDLQFDGFFNFRVYGHLSAVGTETDSIFIHPAPGRDSLKTIIFQQGSADSSRLSYCSITGCAQSAINIYWVNIEISHCNISNNWANWGGGIYVSQASPAISDCIVNNNICGNNGGGIYCTGSAAIITDCVVNGNLCNTAPTTSSGMGGGGICANHSASPVITGCTLIGNHSLWHGGGISLNDNSHAIISYCLLADNACDSSGGGIAIFANCTPEITNCTIADDTTDNFGGAVYISASSPIIKNTIMSGCIGEGGVFIASTDTMLISYCDIYNPSTQNFAGSVPEGLGILDTINANGDSCDIFYNLLMEPAFVDPGNNDYELTSLSPCIDAGDPESPLDPDNTIADQGVFYFFQVGISETPSASLPESIQLYPPHPNPFNPRTALSYQLQAASKVSLAVYDITGRKVSELVDGLRSAGVHEAIFDGTGLASGIYIYRLTAGEFSGMGKMVLMK